MSFVSDWNLGNMVGGNIGERKPNHDLIRNIIADCDEGLCEASEDMSSKQWDEYQSERKIIYGYIKAIDEDMAKLIVDKFGEDRLYQHGWEILKTIAGGKNE